MLQDFICIFSRQTALIHKETATQSLASLPHPWPQVHPLHLPPAEYLSFCCPEMSTGPDSSLPLSLILQSGKTDFILFWDHTRVVFSKVLPDSNLRPPAHTQHEQVGFCSITPALGREILDLSNSVPRGSAVSRQASSLQVKQILRRRQIRPHWMFVLDSLLSRAVRAALAVLGPGRGGGACR